MVGEWKKLSRDCDREKLDLEDKTSAYSTLKSERKLIAGENRTTPLKAYHCQPENKRLASQREREVPLSKTPSPHIVRTSDHSDLEKREVDKGEN